ncbi:carbohydrate kinase [Corynebacterium sp. sy017]|uniref:carbohydrate kinase family protein n=1 Tax=unclassified Corynebacterium TaxID=2624378 RepID=UPI0011848BAA|nr:MULTISPECIES: carbohydrate kinase [unclassified Corynebacterium]MBP3088573.1 carbohydrate kinase [Corynebacterium sp. sy017]QDZ41984.1 carbohydrate kinase [Corynebacterium sp. sy039]TSD91870.1 carbohydrate kinase [Corynebacterium sp. SY003]
MITVCGEGLIDLVPQHTDKTQKSEHTMSQDSGGSLAALQPVPGGGPFNVAIAASRMGARTQFLSQLSTDPFGQALVDTLNKEGVNTHYVTRSDLPTSLALSSIGADGSAQYSFYLEQTADRFVTPPTHLDTDIACFGTVSLALEPGASRYSKLLKNLAAQGTFIALDPNIRSFYATPEHREFLLSLLDDVTLLKLSAEEDEFLGHPRTPITVITHGAGGLEVIINQTSADLEATAVTVPAPTITVSDTIGAGDTVMGALLAELDRRIPAGSPRGTCDILDIFDINVWTEIASYAAYAAAITCSRTGAQPPTRQEVLEFMER